MVVLAVWPGRTILPPRRLVQGGKPSDILARNASCKVVVIVVRAISVKCL
jgi:hypothetical protein